MSFVTGVVLLAVLTSLACALPGVFVVLRKNSMLVDAIAHAVFPGIVLGFALTHDLRSPLLVLGAALTGLLVVLGSEYLQRTGLVTGDAPQGLVFPALFSVGVIMVSAEFSNIHLDTHAVLVGDLNLAAISTLTVGGVQIGPSYLYVMLGVLIVNVAFIALLYPQLSVTTFDPAFATSIGVPVRALNTAFMFLVAFTITAAFNAAGAILVLALMIVPGATAYLLSGRLGVVLALTAVIAVAGSLVGFWIAYRLNAATSAGMSMFYGLLFTAVLGLTWARQRVRTDRARIALSRQ